MGVTRVTQEAFTGGELTPAVHQRPSLDKYPIGASLLRNFYVSPHGGFSNRGGHEYVVEYSDSSKKGRMLTFQFSVDQYFVVQLEEYLMRFIWENGAVLISEEATVWADDSSYPLGAYVAYLGEKYYCYVATVYVATPLPTPLAAPENWQLVQDDILAIRTPYSEAELPYIKFAQDKDIIYLTHPNHPTMTLTRYGVEQWEFIENEKGSSMTQVLNLTGTGSTNFTYNVTAVGVNGDESEVAAAEVTANLGDELTWDDNELATSYNVYLIENGSHYKIGNTVDSSYEIPADTMRVDRLDSAPIVANPMSEEDTYPGVLAFYQQRMTYGRPNESVGRIQASKTKYPDNFNLSSPLKASDPYVYNIDGRRLSEIMWFVAMEQLIIGTDEAVWSLTGQGGGPVTPTDIPKMITQTDIGVSYIQPLVVGKTILFLEGNNAVVQDLAFSLDVEGYDGDDVSILGEHLFEGHYIVAWCYQRYPDSIVWCVRDDGVVLGLTYYRKHKIWAWHQHTTGGSSGAHQVEDIVSIRTSAKADVVYRAVNRTINGETKRYIERSRKRIEVAGDVSTAFMVDSGLVYDDVPAQVISGLDHLEGETVVALADGNVIRNLVVESGTVDLGIEASYVVVGLGYVCDFTSLGLQGTASSNNSLQSSSLQGREKSVVELEIRVRNARQALVGPDEDHLDPIAFRENEKYGESNELWEGSKKTTFTPTDSGTDAKVHIQTVDPVPLTVLSYTAKIEYGDG